MQLLSSPEMSERHVVCYPEGTSLISKSLYTFKPEPGTLQLVRGDPGRSLKYKLATERNPRVLLNDELPLDLRRDLDLACLSS